MSKPRSFDSFLSDLKKKNIDVDIIGEYKNIHTKIKIRCKACGYIWEKVPNNILYHGVGCPNCYNQRRWKNRLKSDEEFKKEVYEKNPSLEILDQYTGENNNITIKCKKCGNVWVMNAGSFFTHCSCAVCSNKRVAVGINDIATTHPELVKYFKNPDDAKKYTYGSMKRVVFKCPNCGYEKELSISSFFKNNCSIGCPVCGDGVSFPNKFCRSMIMQLPVDYYKFEWTSQNTGKYRFDVYFIYNNQQYIIEMDGPQHYGQTNAWGAAFQEAFEKDRIKDELIKQNNIIMIRINSIKSNKDYLIKQFQSSLLNDLFDLSIVDWDRCNLEASSSLTKRISEYYNNHPKSTIKSIADHFGTDRHVITRYLQRGTELGFCNYKLRTKKPIKVIAQDIQNGTIYNFNSVNEASRELTKLKNILYDNSSILKYLKEKKPYKGFLFLYA